MPLKCHICSSVLAKSMHIQQVQCSLNLLDMHRLSAPGVKIYSRSEILGFYSLFARNIKTAFSCFVISSLP